MPIVELPLGQKPYNTPYTSIGRERCSNLFIEPSNSDDAKVKYYVKSIPGMRLLKPKTASLPCRLMYTASNGLSYGVFGNRFCEIQSDGTLIQKAVIESYTGPVKIADNGIDMILVDGKFGYHYIMASGTFSIINDSYFPGQGVEDTAPTHVCYINGYFIVNNPGTNEYYWSTPNYIEESFDPDNPSVKNRWNGLYFGVKAGRGDNIIALERLGNELFVIGRHSMEIHYDTGNYNGQLWQRQQNAIVNVGTLSPYSISVLGNNIFWIGRDEKGTLGVFTTSTDMIPKKISSIGIDQEFSKIEQYDKVNAFSYAQDNHQFVVFQFIVGDKTFVYDTTTDSWHERTSFDLDTGFEVKWKGIYSTYNYGKLFLGHVDTNAVYMLDPMYYQNDKPDGSGVDYIRRVKTTPIISAEGKNFRYNSAQIVFQQGVGLAEEDPTVSPYSVDPKCWLRWSNDGGVTWSSFRESQIGKVGQYSFRSKYWVLGTGRNRVWEITVSDPVSVIILNMLVDTTPLGR